MGNILNARTASGTAANAPINGAGAKIRIFIGTEPKTEIARKVLECSIRRRTNSEVEFTPMIGPEWEYDHSGFHVGTGFSLRRWMIPEKCGWHGRAIYLDSDQLVFSDIWDLWTMPDQNPIDGCAAWMTYQKSKFSPTTPHPHSSVMVIDCARAKDQKYFHLQACLDYLKKHNNPPAYGRLMFPDWLTPMPGKVGIEWNSLNIFAAGKTKLLHYTKEPEQPWYKPDHPFAMQWKLEFQIALNSGYITPQEVEDAVAKFNTKEDWRSTNGLHPSYLAYIGPLRGKKNRTFYRARDNDKK